MPDSLQLAIKSFIITCAIRRLRGQEKAHNSMLIHITRYTTWQKHTFDCVQATFDKYNNAIKFNDVAILEEFRQVFEGNIPKHKNFIQVSEQILDCSLNSLDAQIQVHKWEDVKKELYKACSKIQIKIINGGSKDTLDYFNHKDGLSVIAIGGDKLSRGLTLEGLSVSYFLRASKMYDTLMQMGRWFGYREGYVDLCRLFTTRQLNEWFCHITMASEELRKEFDYMTNVAGATPEKYALKVRTCPDLLQITASNKLRDVQKIEVSFSARLVETYEFVKNKAIFKQNFTHTHQFIESLGQNDTLNFPKDFVWKNISASKITTFLSNYQVEKDQPLRKAEPSFLVSYISKLVSLGELTNWSVALINNSQTKEMHQYTINNEKINIGLIVRNADENCSTDTSKNRESKGIYYLKKSHIISPNHEYIDLDKNLVDEKIQQQRLEGKKSPYLSGEVVRNELRNAKNPLLMIYSLDAKNTKGLEDIKDLGVPIIGFAISFPKSKQKAEDINLSYAIQTQLLPYFDSDIELEEDDYEN